MAAASSRRSEEQRKSHKTANGDLIINNSDQTATAANLKGAPRKAHVLYYLSRNGHLDHPHLIDVPLSSPYCLYLRDVMKTLNCYRGNGTANMYSWSYKRSYKNGYVWHDASEDDLIQPCNNLDYILKGSELFQTHNQPETLMVVRRRNQSWSSFDNPHEHLVAKCESNRELAAKFAPQQRVPAVELDIPSSPPSNSSSEAANGGDRTTEDQHGSSSSSGRIKVSRVMMQLITCGGDSVTK